jgi:hypothetical protein
LAKKRKGLWAAGEIARAPKTLRRRDGLKGGAALKSGGGPKPMKFSKDKAFSNRFI